MCNSVIILFLFFFTVFWYHQTNQGVVYVLVLNAHLMTIIIMEHNRTTTMEDNDEEREKPIKRKWEHSKKEFEDILRSAWKRRCKRKQAHAEEEDVSASIPIEKETTNTEDKLQKIPKPMT